MAELPVVYDLFDIVIIETVLTKNKVLFYILHYDGK